MGDSPQTIHSICMAFPDLNAMQVSMALSYLLRKGIVKREQVDRISKTGRKRIWSYTIAVLSP